MSIDNKRTQATSIKNDGAWNISLHVISDKTGIEREKEVKQALGRVLISAIKQKLAHDEGL